jgi:MFS family permease
VRPRRPLLVATLSSLMYPVPLFFLAARSSTPIIAVAAFVGGLFMAVFMVLWTTTMQREIPTHVLSRVSAYDWFGSLAFVPIGMALAGPVASSIGMSKTLVGSGVIMILLILATLLVPSVVRLSAPTGKESARIDRPS